MKKVEFQIDEIAFEEVTIILEDLGLNLENFFKMAVRKLQKEKGIEFLISKESGSSNREKRSNWANFKMPKVDVYASDDSSKSEFSQGIDDFIQNVFDSIRMTKNSAVGIFRHAGVTITSRNITFSSKNRSVDHYWSTPNKEVLDEDWYLILNDWLRKEIHLFKVPKGSFTYADFVMRADDDNVIDLQITYNDPTFTDKRSLQSFGKFLLKTASYYKS